MIMEAIIVWASFQDFCEKPAAKGSKPKPFVSLFKPKPPVLTPPTTDPSVLAKLDAWHAEAKKVGSFYVQIKERWYEDVWKKNEERVIQFWSIKGDRYWFHYSGTAPSLSIIGNTNVVTELRHKEHIVAQFMFQPSCESADYGWFSGYIEFLKNPMPFLNARPKEESLERYNFEILSESDKEIVIRCIPRRANDYVFKSTEIIFDKAKPWIPTALKINDGMYMREMTVEIAVPIDGIPEEHFDTEAIIKKLCDPAKPVKSRWTCLRKELPHTEAAE